MTNESNQPAVTQPRPITHVGVTVTDMNAALEWYKSVLGFQLIHGPASYTAGEGYFGKLVADMLGPKVVSGQIAMLDTGNSACLELFAFSDPQPERRGAEENQEFYLHKTGTFHYCVTDPDVEGLAKRIVETGGKQRSEIWEFSPGIGFYVCYCEDPFGNIVEIYSHSTPHIWSALEQQSKLKGEN